MSWRQQMLKQTTLRKSHKPVRPRLIGPPEPVNENGRAPSPQECVRRSVYLSALFREMHRPMPPNPVDFGEIIDTLTAKKIPFVLTGAHAIGTWTGRPRATHDVDILAKGGRNCARAVKALRALYPALEVRDLSGVMAFFVPGEDQSVIDVTFPHRVELQVTFETAIWIEFDSRRLRIPTLEAALARKYGSMRTRSRDVGHRAQDAVDFAWMVCHSDEPDRRPIDLTLLESLGKTVWPSGGGKEILDFVAQARAGTVPTVSLR
jgi:hypothetical protein